MQKNELYPKPEQVRPLEKGRRISVTHTVARRADVARRAARPRHVRALQRHRVDVPPGPGAAVPRHRPLAARRLARLVQARARRRGCWTWR